MCLSKVYFFFRANFRQSRNLSDRKHAVAYSRGTKVEKMKTLAPKRYTAGFCMVAKVMLWCI